MWFVLQGHRTEGIQTKAESSRGSVTANFAARLITALAIREQEEEVVVLIHPQQRLVTRWGGRRQTPSCVFHTWKNDMPT